MVTDWPSWRPRVAMVATGAAGLETSVVMASSGMGRFLERRLISSQVSTARPGAPRLLGPDLSEYRDWRACSWADGWLHPPPLVYRRTNRYGEPGSRPAAPAGECSASSS